MLHLVRLLCLTLLLPTLAAETKPVQLSGESLPHHLSFRTYGAELGMSGVSVYQLQQDRQGFIWVGTDAGLFRYDGYRFTAFGPKDGLPSSEILALHEDQKGVLWIGTRQGLAQWNGYALAAADKSQGLPAGPITGLASSRGTVWVGTDRGPFVRGRDGRFTLASGWPGGAVTSLWARPPSAKVWVASWDGSAHVHAHDERGWTAITIPAEMQAASIDAMAEDATGRLWARAPRLLWALDKGASRFRAATAPFPLISDRGHLQAGNHGDIWIPTQDGLVHLDNNVWTRLTAEHGLPTTWSRSVLIDREGSLWVGSTGLARLLGHGAWRAYTRADGLPSDIIWNFFRDRDRQLWVGTDDGPARLTSRGWVTIPGFEGRGIRTVIQGADGVFYMAGTPGTDLFRYDAANGRIDVVNITRDAAPKRIFRLMIDDRQRLWAGTDGAGLFVADTKAPALRFERVGLPGGTLTEPVRDVHQDARGRIWVTGENGLAMLEDNRWRRFNASSGLKHDSTSFVRSTRNGDLLVSYNEPLGVTRLRYQNGALRFLRQFDTRSGLADDKVYMFGEDAKSRIWIGTPKGIDLFQPAGVDHFGVAEGLISEDVDNMAFLAEPNGDAWIGTSGGIAHFQDRLYPGVAVPPRTVFLSLQLGQAKYRGDEERPQMRFDSNVFESRFATLNFVHETATRQEVRLLGLESDWRVTDTREARYASLPYGEYRFEVRSRVGEGPPGPTTAFAFEVLRPWWHTWWFRTLLALGSIGLILLLVRWRMRSLQQQNRQLEEQVAARTQELEVSNDALKNQSLTDPLTGLRNRRFVAECMPGDVAQALRLSREAEGSQVDRMALNIDLLFIMIDLDQFKLVNDQHGHHAGDKVLQQMALILKEASRDADTVVRWGGEEFLIVARQVCRNDFTVMAERIRSKSAAHLFDLGDGETIRLTCSIGFALFPFVPQLPGAHTWERVVDLADGCLYTAKRSGRNAWVGVCPVIGGDYERAASAQSGTVGQLISDGILQVRSSLPEATLEWGEDG